MAGLASGIELASDGGSLLAEDLEHSFALSPIHLRQRLRDQGAILGAAVVQHLVETKSGVTHEDLGVLEALVVVRDAQVHLMSDRLDLFEQISRLFNVARSILLKAEFGHLVDKLSVEEALLARLSLGNPGLEGRDAVLVDRLIVGGRRQRGDGERCDSEKDGRPRLRPHEEPPLVRN
jgi:hypothetical protein